MLKRFSKADKICAVTASLVALATYLPWFHGTTATDSIAVNGFRSGLFGVLAFVAAAAVIGLLLLRHGVLRLGLDHDLPEGRIFVALGTTAVVAIVMQFMIGGAGGHSAGKGFLLALLAAGVLAWGCWEQHQDDHRPTRAFR